MAVPCPQRLEEELDKTTQRKIERKCFWQRPWGHCYHETLGRHAVKCCKCPKIWRFSSKKV